MSPDARHPVSRTIVTGEGPPVVLVPGGLTGWASWERHAEVLAATRRVIRAQLLSVDLGLEGRPLPEGYRLTTETDALERALDELGLDRTDLVGWSYGGAIALDLAMRDPGRVRSLTVIEPAAYWILQRSGRAGEDVLAFADDMRGYAVDEVDEDRLRRFVVNAGLVAPGEDPTRATRWPVWWRHRNSLRLADVPFRHDDELERLRRLDLPVLAFLGEGSPDYVREVVEILVREIPEARRVELPGGHGLPHVSFDRFLSILEAFLNDPRAPAPQA